MDLYIRASEIKNNHNLILYRNRNESTFMGHITKRFKYE